MKAEYSINGTGFAYSFEKWEADLIAKLLSKEIPKLEKKIKKIEEDPENEGQATFLSEISEIRGEISSIKDIIENIK